MPIPSKTTAVLTASENSRSQRFWWPDLKLRCRLPELMDDPALENDLHLAALNGLRRINKLSRSSAILWAQIHSLATEVKRPLRVLDVATGGGDLVVSLSQKANLAGIDITVDGCDISSRALGYAQEYAAKQSPLKSTFFHRDVLSEGIPGGYDIVTCSLFLHHLSRSDAVSFLHHMRTACTTALLVSDLRRTRIGYLLAIAAGHVITRSSVVHVDGPLSVRAAWSDDEVRQLTCEAEMSDALISHHWPQRFLLSWRRS